MTDTTNTTTTTSTSTTTDFEFDDSCDYEGGRIADTIHGGNDYTAVLEVEDLSDIGMVPFAETEPSSTLDVFHRSDTLVGYGCRLVPDIASNSKSTSSSGGGLSGHIVNINSILAKVGRVPEIAVDISPAPKVPEAMQMDGQESPEGILQGHDNESAPMFDSSDGLLIGDGMDISCVVSDSASPIDVALYGDTNNSYAIRSSNSHGNLSTDASISCGWVHPHDDALLTPLSTELLSTYECMRFKQELFLKADICRTLVELLRVLYRDNLMDSSK
jgi:hypothetical protein